ncbi:MAG: hypothetical protein GWM90_15635 [Gemmatimonadetes bacterium]|nr:hypothetical protein [Gemmatimonadota bacterium]NIQ55647.1 hypothetical protein [Gemmatimonadota bacterium]NIU75850.1 hypothetical protein [Gammaproteobacteria bacterium]NIX45482.1 hypothetical protein [Gemmatimonadota bacterium]NIY09764.1 hypothetical protein [Gemmatimonadota bacterium]
MARVRITKRDGSTTPYFWSDKEQGSKTRKTVYKQTADGVKRMRGVRFDPVTNRMHKD